ncbi:uncharacterized protein LOC114941586 [Nylanderia fulva]|uniref:uncharacterized protein LOC114941586 n=1 Tax=Nylanderia fulva TaxID=613905 RepID=UPI0010FAEC94|nr:uncharacterized protein LOC114941586 [Nylanderia fulva]
MEGLLAEQKVTLKSITRSLENFKKIGKDNLTYGIVRSRLQKLKDDYARYEHTHAKVLALATEDFVATHKYFTEDRFSACEAAYYTASDYMAEWEAQLEPQATSTPEPSSIVSHRQNAFTSRSAFQLPRISLPRFSGEFSDWESFRDQFKALIIENSDLVDVNRLQYLHSCVKGDAFDIVRNLALVDSNFKVAWDLLIARYDNKRRLVHEHIHELTSLTPINSESASALSALRDKANVAIKALKHLGRAVDQWDDILVYLIVQKFDKATRKAWELQLGDTTEYPTFDSLEHFLTSRIRAFENILPFNKGKTSNQLSVQSHVTNTSAMKCPVCQKPHLLFACPEFRNKPASERREIAQRVRCCYNCLSTKHNRKNCQSKHTCQQCQQKHHTLLHEVDTSKVNEARSPTASTSTADEPVSINTHVVSRVNFSKTGILLATAWVAVHSATGTRDVVRALLDQGSVTTLISERLAQRLRLKRSRVSVSITGIGCAASVAKQAARIDISPRDMSGPVLSVTALILKTLTNYIPQRVESLAELEYLRSLNLADSDPTSSEPIDIIIGADLYGSVLRSGIRSRSSQEPVAQNSIFGWILSGPMFTELESASHQLSTHHCTVYADLDMQLKRFWEIEELPRSRHISPEEKRCEEHFASTHSRSPTGRYIVRLPFKTPPPLSLGDSRSAALALYTRAEARLKARPEQATEYHAFLQEYKQLGHMMKVSSPRHNSNQIIYIPHHAVIREHSATTHLRVVFNASSPTSNGLSLNDHLMIGPKLQTDLPSILTRWRQFRYVYTADIAKMYRQILVDQRDTDYQRILWRSDVDAPIEDYQLQTVTYGTASAPYLAIRVLNQLALDDGHDFPAAVPVLQQHTYVDDCVFGADDIPLARKTKDQLVSLLNRAGFQLRKWASNNQSLLADIDPHDHGLAQAKTLQTDDSLKVLGLKWNPYVDAFQFEISLSTEVPATKRAVLATIATIFDPLGWLTPVVITAKIFMQKLWTARCEWDAVLPHELFAAWRSYYAHLSTLREILIPRWNGYGSDTVSAEIHGFADASTAAYGAVVYLKLTKRNGSVKITLMSAKSKVAPLKPLTVPRLELSATVLLARLIAFVRTLIPIPSMICHCWTDSTVVLAWLKQSPARWKIFVANRVHEVQSQVPDAIWHHVPSPQNPADLASRGVQPADLKEHLLWWQGPAWLQLPSTQWPEGSESVTTESLTEARAHVHIAQTPNEWELMTRFSSWTKLLRVTAYIRRFTQRLRYRRSQPLASPNAPVNITKLSLSLAPDEIDSARKFWLKSIQQQLFSTELLRLKDGKSVQKGSKLASLNPFLDNDDLIRVGGRLRHSELAEKTKHPIVLASHSLVSSLIRHIHLQALHAGSRLTLSILREDFWLIRARQTIRSVLYHCIACTRENAKIIPELMGDLPDYRVRPVARGFSHCGIDYAGPIKVRTTPGRGHKSQKAYIAIFICMTVKATHLELVGDLSTPSFLAAFDRFCARRGVPTAMYSDNATNFQGAQRELATAWHTATHDSNILNNLAEKGISWRFIPPSSPHFGGLWEACVRSVKFHLKRVIGAHTLTIEEMSTLLCKVEACLNSRPLGQMSDNYDDYHALTPSHFLIGSSMLTMPETSLLDEKETRLTRWQLIRQMRDSLWKQWSQDYLHTLQQRPKWRERQSLARVGRLVLLRNPLAPPCAWELGRIVECHPGDDGLVRVVTVKTARSSTSEPSQNYVFYRLT